MTDDKTNVIHPAFNNLLIEEEFDENLGALVAKKRSRTSDKDDFYVFTKLVGIDLKYDIETEKNKLIANNGKEAYNSEFVKYPLWPVMSYRAVILLDPGERQTFYYLTGATDNKYDISYAIVNSDYESLEKEIEFAGQKENINAKYLKLKPGKAEAYNKIISNILFRNEIEKKDMYWDKSYSQSMLWKYSISGDIPIVTVKIGRLEDSAMVDEAIAFMDYVKSRKVDLDIVLLVDEPLYSGEPIKTHIEEILRKVVFMTYTRGNIYIINIKSMEENEKGLFNLVAKYEIKSIEDFKPKTDEKTKDAKKEVSSDE